jgi:hypothetical protein
MKYPNIEKVSKKSNIRKNVKIKFKSNKNTF